MTCGQMIKFSLSKLVVECFGTFMLTLFFYGNSQAILLSGLWILIVFAWKISGSHFNPAITAAYMFRRDAKVFPKTLGVAYIVAQVGGAFLAALVLVFFTNNNVAKMALVRHCYLNSTEEEVSCFSFACAFNNECDEKVWYFRAIVQEALGSFICVLFFMMQTDEKMFFSREKAINCFIIASSYIAARAMFNGTAGAVNVVSLFGACLNPAIALGLILGALFNGTYGTNAFTTLWLYPVMPFAGSVLALLFYEFVYKKTTETLEHDTPHEDDGILDN